MIENEKFIEVYNIIEKIEVNSRVREIKNNKEKLEGYWHIGKLLFELGNGKKTYGLNIIKEWSIKLAKDFGNFYSETNLKNMRQFYSIFQKRRALRDQLTWTHYRYILPIKNENERNYYINQIILNNLSTRELVSLIKSKSFDRLSYADKENIKLIDDNNYSLSIEDMIKDPIILRTNQNITNFNELTIHKLIIDKLEERFLELGVGFALIGHEYKINIGDRTYKIDLLFFNYELNCFVVMEIKTNENKPKDIGQLEIYVNHIDKT